MHALITIETAHAGQNLHETTAKLTDGSWLTVKNHATFVVGEVDLVAQEDLKVMENVASPRFHKVVLSMVLKHNQELGHGLFLFKCQADFISAVDRS